MALHSIKWFRNIFGYFDLMNFYRRILVKKIFSQSEKAKEIKIPSHSSGPSLNDLEGISPSSLISMGLILYKFGGKEAHTILRDKGVGDAHF